MHAYRINRISRKRGRIGHLSNIKNRTISPKNHKMTKSVSCVEKSRFSTNIVKSVEKGQKCPKVTKLCQMRENSKNVHFWQLLLPKLQPSTLNPKPQPKLQPEPKPKPNINRKGKGGIVRCFVAVWWLCWAVLSIVLSINDATPLSFSLLDLVSPAQPINKKRKSSRVCIVSQLPAVGRSIDRFAGVRVCVILLLIAKIVNFRLIHCWGYIFE